MSAKTKKNTEARSQKPEAVWQLKPVIKGYNILKNGRIVAFRRDYISAAARCLIMKSQEAS